MNAHPSFGGWLKERRKRLDLTQLDLAERVGCSEHTVQKIESGERRPSKQVAQRLAECLSISPEEQDAFVVAARNGALPGLSPADGQGQAPFSPLAPTNLPTPLTPLIGREEAVAEACNYLLNGTRLLTLTGAPGIGKTRLSLQVAAELLPHFEDGVFLVELAPISDPDLVPNAIADTLRLSETANQPMMDTVKQFLRNKGESGRQLLLLLDNFEQVLDAASVVVEMLGASPQLKMLVTSREALHVMGEQQFPVPPLRLPDLMHLPDWQVLPDYPSIQLFVQRARASNPGFRLTHENARHVATVCARLEGLPLAIELAAARSKFFSPQVLLSYLQSSLNSATGMGAGGARGLPHRQQTLRNAIEWSYELLSEEEKRLFRRLGVFVGGRSIEAVEAVCNAGGDLGIDVVEGLISLVDKSLLRQEEGASGEPRFVMLEMIQEYARDKLQESGEDGPIKRLHAIYFASLAEGVDPRVSWGPAEYQRLDRLEEEHDNLRAAIRWSRTLGGDIEIALRLVVALGGFWKIHGHLSEGRETIVTVLSEPESQAEDLRSLRAWAVLQLSPLAYWQGDYVASRSAAEEALILFRALGESQGITHALTELWNSVTAEGDHEKALALATEALRIAREIGYSDRTVVPSVMMGWSLMYLGNLTQADTLLEETVIVARELGGPHGIGLALAALGEVKIRQGSYDQALGLLEEALATLRSMGYRSHMAATLGVMALGAIRQEEYGRATEFLAESLAVRKEIGDKGGVAWCLEKFAQIESERGDPARAACLLGAAEALRETLGNAVDIVDQAEHAEAVRVARDRLGEEAFGQAWQKGRAMSMDEAVAYALMK